jgi:glutaconate CoA-transferase, subunit A
MSEQHTSPRDWHDRPDRVQTRADKRVRLEDLAGMVNNGNVVAIGGGLSSREPMAILRALLRRGVGNLRVVGSAHGIDIDLLCGGGAVSRSSAPAGLRRTARPRPRRHVAG